MWLQSVSMDIGLLALKSKYVEGSSVEPPCATISRKWPPPISDRQSNPDFLSLSLIVAGLKIKKPSGRLLGTNCKNRRQKPIFSRQFV